MRKLFLSISLLAMAVAFGSCNKDSQVTPLKWDNGIPTEGVYAPEVQIAQLNIGANDVQQWQWDGTTLKRIVLTGETVGIIDFAYAGGLLSQVTENIGNGKTTRFTYNNGQLSHIAVNIDGEREADMQVRHDQYGRTTGADIRFSGSYLLSLLRQYRNGNPDMAANEMAEWSVLGTLAEWLEHLGILDESLDNKIDHNFSLTYNWNNYNVMSEVLDGSVRLELDAQHVVDDLSLLPENIRMAIYTYLSEHNKLPVRVSFSNIATYTFDSMNNPYYGYQGNGLSVRNLSRNNILGSQANGEMTVELLIGDWSFTLYRKPINKSVDRSYHYNWKDYPIQMTGNGLTVITYNN